jgi:hypothetical protein
LHAAAEQNADAKQNYKQSPCRHFVLFPCRHVGGSCLNRLAAINRKERAIATISSVSTDSFLPPVARMSHSTLGGPAGGAPVPRKPKIEFAAKVLRDGLP